MALAVTILALEDLHSAQHTQDKAVNTAEQVRLQGSLQAHCKLFSSRGSSLFHFAGFPMLAFFDTLHELHRGPEQQLVRSSQAAH